MQPVTGTSNAVANQPMDLSANRPVSGIEARPVSPVVGGFSMVDRDLVVLKGTPLGDKIRLVERRNLGFGNREIHQIARDSLVSEIQAHVKALNPSFVLNTEFLTDEELNQLAKDTSLLHCFHFLNNSSEMRKAEIPVLLSSDFSADEVSTMVQKNEAASKEINFLMGRVYDKFHKEGVYSIGECATIVRKKLDSFVFVKLLSQTPLLIPFCTGESSSSRAMLEFMLMTPEQFRPRPDLSLNPSKVAASVDLLSLRFPEELICVISKALNQDNHIFGGWLFAIATMMAMKHGNREIFQKLIDLEPNEEIGKENLKIFAAKILGILAAVRLDTSLLVSEFAEPLKGAEIAEACERALDTLKTALEPSSDQKSFPFLILPEWRQVEEFEQRAQEILKKHAADPQAQASPS